MRNFITFLKSRQFFIQTGLILLLISLIIFGTLKWLESYTNHGEFVKVPDFKGQKIVELDEFIKNKNISYQIIDSVYDPREKAGVVLRQDPEVNVAVKHNRTVYLYVTGMVPPQIAMPKLIDRSERQARLIINSYGLKMGKVIEVDADCNGCVLAQKMGGREIEPGSGVQKGSVIDLEVGVKGNSYQTTDADSTAVNDELNFNDE